MTASRVRVYDKLGNFLAELDVATVRTWVRNDIGTCTFTVSQLDPKCKESILQYGNLVLVEHSTLPDWVGMIDVERQWNPGSLTQNVTSAERFLGLRAMPMMNVEGSAGKIFKEMISYCNSPDSIAIRSGDIDTGGDVIKLELSLSALEHARELVETGNYSFSVTPELTAAGVLRLFANWRRGGFSSKRQQMLSELNISEGSGSPLEMSSPIMTEQGEFWTELIGYSDASTKKSRLTTGPIRDELAFDKYGLRQANVVFSGVKDLATLRHMTAGQLYENNAPVYTVSLRVADVKDASGNSIYFSRLRIGNIVNLTLNSAGFTGQDIGYSGSFRISGMSYSDVDNKVELTVETWGFKLIGIEAV